MRQEENVVKELDISAFEGRLTPHEAADILAVKVRTLADWRRRRVGPPFIRLSNGRVSYIRKEVEHFALIRKKAPEVTGRKEKPLLQQRLDRSRAEVDLLIIENRKLKAALEKDYKHGLWLEDTNRNLQSKASETLAHSQQWQDKTLQLKADLKDTKATLNHTQFLLNQRDQIIIMLNETDQQLTLRYQMETEAGRVSNLNLAFLASLKTSLETARQRLFILYADLVPIPDGTLQPLDGRKPSKAIIDNNTAVLVINGLLALFKK